MKPLKNIAEDVRVVEDRMRSLLETTEQAIITMGNEVQAAPVGSLTAMEVNMKLTTLMTRITLGHTQALHELAVSVRELAEHMQPEPILPRITAYVQQHMTPRPPEDTWAPFEDLPLNGLRCSDCGEPQRETPSGGQCVNGHGGVLGIP